MNPSITEGFYQNPVSHDVYRVLRNKRSGALYAKRMRPNGQFHTVRGALFGIEPAWEVGLDVLKALGKRFGRCCLCGRTLTDPISVNLGIGPVCERRYKTRQTQPADETPENQ